MTKNKKKGKQKIGETNVDAKNRQCDHTRRFTVSIPVYIIIITFCSL